MYQLVLWVWGHKAGLFAFAIRISVEHVHGLVFIKCFRICFSEVSAFEKHL